MGKKVSAVDDQADFRQQVRQRFISAM